MSAPSQSSSDAGTYGSQDSHLNEHTSKSAMSIVDKPSAEKQIIEKQPAKAITTTTTTTARPQTASSLSTRTPHSASGILTISSVRLKYENGQCNVSPEPRFDGIPIAAIALLDIANSSDFAANVFNQIPVPIYAIVLMALGGTFALFMSGVAYVDARRSWQNIRLLKKERQELFARENAGDSDCEKGVETAADVTLLSLNKRDIRNEFFERCGMETTMGVAAFMVSVGTFMAIGGANRRVYEASNLLSGYIGNAPTAAYGLINAIWAVIAWRRARKQRRAAFQLLSDRPARLALRKRTKTIEKHAVISGITCLVSGALGLLTPRYWYPYPVLLVCGILFIHTTRVFRHQVAYARPLMAYSTRALDQDDIAGELDFLLSAQDNYKRTGTLLSKACFDASDPANSFITNFHHLVTLGLFEEFVKLVIADKILTPKLLAGWDNRKEHLTPKDFFKIDDELYPELVQHCKTCMAKSGRKQVSIRIRFLLEALGTCLINSSGKNLEKALTAEKSTSKTSTIPEQQRGDFGSMKK